MRAGERTGKRAGRQGVAEQSGKERLGKKRRTHSVGNEVKKRGATVKELWEEALRETLGAITDGYEPQAYEDRRGGKDFTGKRFLEVDRGLYVETETGRVYAENMDKIFWAERRDLYVYMALVATGSVVVEREKTQARRREYRVRKQGQGMWYIFMVQKSAEQEIFIPKRSEAAYRETVVYKNRHWENLGKYWDVVNRLMDEEEKKQYRMMNIYRHFYEKMYGGGSTLRQPR
jgi:hypothetical protein